MTDRTDISLGAIVADLRGGRLRTELRTSWAIALLYRLPSVPFVWLAARLGIGPTTVTLTALALALTMPLQAALLPLGAAAIAIAISGALFQVLDCVDGTLARVTGRTTQRGADLDGLVDLAQWALLYLSIGMLADRTFGTDGGWTALAAAAAWSRLYARTVRDTLPDPSQEQPVQSLSLAALPVVFITGLSGLLPFLALAGPYLWLSVWFLMIYALLDLGEALLALRHSDRA